ncbi:MAG: serine/threonine-protein kinase [Polyangiaceae bacterium]
MSDAKERLDQHDATTSDRVADVDEVPTVVETPRVGSVGPAGSLSESATTRVDLSHPPGRAARSGSDDATSSTDLGTGPSDVGSASVTTLRQTLHSQDAERSRSFALGTAAVAAVIGLPLPLLGGDPIVKRVFAASLVLLVLSSLYTYRRLADPAAYSMRLIMRAAAMPIVAAYCGIFYFGVFSPAVAVVPFGLFFFGLAQSFRHTVVIYTAASLAYVAMALPIALGWVVDRGVVRGDELGRAEALMLVFAVQVVFFATYSIARLSRRAAERALAEHDRAVRAIAGRDALLQEARLDLEGVLRARGLGRFTDERVGNYQLGRILGRGGMGEVYEARHVDSEEPAAVKLLHPHILSDEAAVRRFFRECIIASSLDVPNVVKVTETSGDDDPIPFIAMERLRGEDLSDYLRAHGRMRPRDVIRMLREVGRGLDAAREAGIVHRDLKPRNLFLAQMAEGARGVWKILDFGVSKLAGEATMTGNDLIGTPSYMAPEQAEGGDVTHATDLYALGVIAYRALTGVPAFTGDAPAAILYRVVRHLPPAPSETAARLPEAVDAVLAIAMAKSPRDRFASAAELADALEQALRGRLSSELERRAKTLLAELPWGS